MISRDVVAYWLGVDPSDVIAWDLLPVGGQLRVLYRDEQHGILAPRGCDSLHEYPITRRLRLKTTHEIEEI